MPKSGQVWDPHFDAKSALFAPFRHLTAPLGEFDRWPGVDVYTALAEGARLRCAPDERPLEFVASRPKPRRFRRKSLCLAELYDGSIAELGQVPSVTESYHDLFNAIAFAAFPRAKRALHARQYGALRSWVDVAQAKLPSRRTREQDALTVFDEGGTVLAVTTAFTRRWRASGHDVELGESDLLVLFGHALMEHVWYGRLELRSCALLLEHDGASTPSLDWIDREVARRLRDPERFRAPGGDGVVRLDSSGLPWLERSIDGPGGSRP